MTTYLITQISAGSWGRSGYGPDWHGDTQEGFVGLFGYQTWASFSMSYETYMSVAKQYRDELDSCSNVTITGVPVPDPCEGVICEDVCDDTDLYGTVCEDGICVRGRLIEEDSSTCGYIPPEPEPPEPGTQWDMIILAIVVGVLFYLLVTGGSS